MRSFIALALVGATTVVAQSSAIQDALNSVLPECLHECTINAMEDLSGCSIDDTKCLCGADGTGLDQSALTGVVSSLASCAESAGCSEDDLMSILNADTSEYENQVKTICSDSSSGDNSSDDASDDTANDNTDSTDESTDDSSDDTSDSTSNSNDESTDDSSDNTSDSNSNSNSNSNSDNTEETANDNTDSGEENVNEEVPEDAAIALTATNAALAAGALMLVAAL
ncbi:hypothetical protein BJY04DRAFT_194150 [Aspergillus karnatakaensis]|uniref:uncharacterized protein n=1 Tax=Aspergillus karnatakaensis TaxID=1810916 RepID=UPI003CCCD660